MRRSCLRSTGTTSRSAKVRSHPSSDAGLDGPRGGEGRTLRELEELDLPGLGALGAGLRLELHPLATDESVEIGRRLQCVAVEEVLLAVARRDEAEAPIRHELLDCPVQHAVLLCASRVSVGPGCDRVRTQIDAPSVVL